MRDHELYAGGRRAVRAGGEPSAVRRAGGGAAAGAGHRAAHGQALPELRSAGRSWWGPGRWGGVVQSGLLARRRGATEPLLEGGDPPLEAGHALRVVSSAFQDGFGEPVEPFVQAVELLALRGHHADN